MPDTKPTADPAAQFWEFIDKLTPFSFAPKPKYGPAAAPSYDPKADPEMLRRSIEAEDKKLGRSVSKPPDYRH